MKLTCAQMDVLISFYIDNDLSKILKTKVEEHLESCPACRAKYEIIKSMLTDLKTSIGKDESLPEEVIYSSVSNVPISSQYRVFQNKLSAYIDNELSNEDNIKIKKFTINNKKARKELEDTYNIRKLMNDSFRKTKADAKHDFSKNVLKQLELEDEAVLGIHPVIKILIGFTVSVLVFTTIVLFSIGV